MQFNYFFARRTTNYFYLMIHNMFLMEIPKVTLVIVTSVLHTEKTYKYSSTSNEEVNRLIFNYIQICIIKSKTTLPNLVLNTNTTQDNDHDRS